MRKYIINESARLAYHQTLFLAKNRLVTLGGDGREDEYGDTLHGSLLNLIDYILEDMANLQQNPIEE